MGNESYMGNEGCGMCVWSTCKGVINIIGTSSS
jgi:hypothetical protein